MNVLHGFTALLGLQLVGEILSRLLSLPIPGPVVGLVLLLALLSARPALMPMVSGAGDALLAHLSLLFIPAGVGVLVHIDRLVGVIPGVVATLVLSTLLGMSVTALILQRLMRGRRTRDTPGHDTTER